MKLIIGNQPIAIPADASISLEKSSPALEEKVGSFSYPFAIPNFPNEKILGFPGKLERVGELTTKSFILEDQGIQVLRGEVEYDTVTRDEIGIILKSGITEFNAKVESVNLDDNGASLADIDFGSEPWFGYNLAYIGDFNEKLTAWDNANRADNAPYVVAPFRNYAGDTPVVLGNKHYTTGYLLKSLPAGTANLYMLQFRAWWMLEKIFTSFGYTIQVNELKESQWKDLIVFTRPFNVSSSPADPEQFPDANQGNVIFFPSIDNLVYAHLMPDCKVSDFLDKMKALMGLVYDIDDLKKEVKMTLIKNIFGSTGETTELIELSGWQHKEKTGSTSSDGYELSYETQDSELDNRGDYTVDVTVDTVQHMPLNASEGYIVRVSSINRDYIVAKNDTNEPGFADLLYKEIGRLKPYLVGKGKNKIDIEVKVPRDSYYPMWIELAYSVFYTGPRIYPDITNSMPSYNMGIYNITEIAVSIYRGTVTNLLQTTIPFQSVPIPFLSACKWFPSDSLELTPTYLFNSIYSDYLSWKSSGARSFTKYVKMTLPQMISLKWGNRYIISGVKVILSKMNYDLPFTGVVKVEGYVA